MKFHNGKSCFNCKYVYKHGVSYECHRYPPKAAFVMEQQVACYPVVYSYDWCGEWTLKRKKRKKHLD